MNPDQIIDIHVWRRESDQATVLEIHTRRQVISVPMDEAKRHMLIHKLGRPRSEKLDTHRGFEE